LPASAAGTWQLGDVTVSRLGFGAMRLLRRAAELGVNHIDAARLRRTSGSSAATTSTW
jgi:aryl-alcohol dehydrogenase-like predicted oxidoreductase